MTESDKKYLKAIGNNIAKLRRKNNLSQLDVCAEIKMEKPNLSSIENGRQNPTSLTLKKIADVLDVDVKDFFNFK
jgi:transcriptional regulator with XRE-family HTH domain